MAERVRRPFRGGRTVAPARGHADAGPVHLEPLSRGDVEAVTRLAEACFERPWPRDCWDEELGREVATVWGLRTAGGRLVAFVDFWTVRDEVHVLNLATAVDARRRGHATRLLQAVLAHAAARRARFVTLEVRRGNAAARALYRRLGFRRFGTRPSYYTDGEDAFVLLRGVPAAAGC